MYDLVDIPTTHLTPQATSVRGHMYSQSVTLQVSSVTLQVKILENQITCLKAMKTKVLNIITKICQLCPGERKVIVFIMIYFIDYDSIKYSY